MTFSGCFFYCKDTCDFDKYITTVYNVLHKLESIMTASRYQISLYHTA